MLAMTSVVASPRYHVVDLGVGHALSIIAGQKVSGGGFLWSPAGGRVDLPVGANWFYQNEAGQVAGSFDPPFRNTSPCVWTPDGGIRDLGRSGYYGYVSGLTSSGVAYGWWGPDTSGGKLQAFRCLNGGALENIHSRVPFPAHAHSAVTDVDDRGRFLIYGFQYGTYIWDPSDDSVINVGPGYGRSFNTSGEVVLSSESVYWVPGLGRQPLPPTSGFLEVHARDINNRGHMVGLAGDQDGWHGWVWDRRGAIRLLDEILINGEGWSIEYADGIDEFGNIVGSAFKNGVSHAVMLVPLKLEFTLEQESVSLEWPYPLRLQTASSPGSGWTDSEAAFGRLVFPRPAARGNFWRVRTP